MAFLPIFLANLVFAGSFRLTGREADLAFASNLLGVMVGGMLEYSALLFGYRNLLLLAIGFYALGDSSQARRPARPAHPPGEPGPGGFRRSRRSRRSRRGGDEAGAGGPGAPGSRARARARMPPWRYSMSTWYLRGETLK